MKLIQSIAASSANENLTLLCFFCAFLASLTCEKSATMSPGTLAILRSKSIGYPKLVRTSANSRTNNVLHLPNMLSDSGSFSNAGSLFAITSAFYSSMLLGELGDPIDGLASLCNESLWKYATNMHTTFWGVALRTISSSQRHMRSLTSYSCARQYKSKRSLTPPQQAYFLLIQKGSSFVLSDSDRRVLSEGSEGLNYPEYSHKRNLSKTEAPYWPYYISVRNLVCLHL